MAIARTIIKNNLVLNLSHILSKIINLALVLVLTRMLGSNGFGIFTFAFAFVVLFMVLGNMGINPLLVRDIARNKVKINSFLGTSIPIIFLLSFLLLLIINGLVFLTSWSELQKAAVRLFSIYFIFDNLSRHFISVFRAFEKMEFEALINLLERLTMLIITLFLWSAGQDLVFLLSCYISIEFIKAILAFLLMHKFINKIKWQWKLSVFLPFVKNAFPFALMTIFGVISGRVDTVMLKYFHTDHLVGLYNASHRLIESIIFIPENFVLALFPALSFLYINEKIKFENILNKGLQLINILAFPISTIIFILAPQIIDLLFENEFFNAYIPLRWLGIALGFIFFKYLFATALNSSGKQNTFAKIAGLSLAINILLNYLLIPHYKLLGASLATVFSEFFAALLGLIAIIPIIKLKINSIKLINTIIATIGLGLFLYFFKNLNIFLLLFIGIIIYITLLFLFKSVSKEEINFIVTKFLKFKSES